MKGLYLHIPFCDKKCTYCDFYSIESKGLIDRFVDSLCREIELRESPLQAHTVFFGGGTPSLLSPDQISRVIAKLHEHFHVDPGAEVTMECNPGTISLNTLTGYKAAGINRLSFGIQSFVQDELKFLTRIHSIQEAMDAIPMARSAGFTNVNADLMFALPPQTMESLQYSLNAMIALQPDHISAYSLVYESGTPLHAQLGKGLFVPHNEEFDADMYNVVMNSLQDAGYQQYEVSNFAKPGFECQHNLVYWHGEDYLAFGPSAHGLIDGNRYWNHRSLTAWQTRVDNSELPHANTETLSYKEQAVEFAFLHIRANGLLFSNYQERFGIDLPSILQPHLSHWLEAGFVSADNNVLRLTHEGYRVCDEITLKIVEAVSKVTG